MKMNPVLAAVCERGYVESPTGERIALTSAVPAAECQLMQSWIVERRPRRLLEVGLAYGISSLYICDALQDLPVEAYHVIDPSQDHFQDIGLKHLHDAGYGSLVTFHRLPSEICLPTLMSEGVRLDFAFIDGNHDFDGALVDFFYINRMLDVHGLVVFDDIHMRSIQQVTACVASLPCYRQIDPPPGFRHSVKAKAREILRMPPYRIAGFEKIARDERPTDWSPNGLARVETTD